MWRTDTPWVDVALMATIFAVGNGVNRWTAEPRERYYQLLGLSPDGRPLRPSPRPDDR